MRRDPVLRVQPWDSADVIALEKHLQIKVIGFWRHSAYYRLVKLADNTTVEMRRSDDRSKSVSRSYRQHYSLTPKTPWKCQRKGPNGELIGDEFSLPTTA